MAHKEPFDLASNIATPVGNNLSSKITINRQSLACSFKIKSTLFLGILPIAQTYIKSTSTLFSATNHFTQSTEL